MSSYQLNASDAFFKELKIAAAKAGKSMKDFILESVEARFSHPTDTPMFIDAYTDHELHFSEIVPNREWASEEVTVSRLTGASFIERITNTDFEISFQRIRERYRFGSAQSIEAAKYLANALYTWQRVIDKQQ